MPKSYLPETPDNPWVDKQYSFNGTWMPAVDPALIGPENYATLQNLRFNDRSIEGVNGYTKVNWTTPISTYTDVRNGGQLRSDRTIQSYVLVHAKNPSGNQGQVYQNTTAVGAEGDFDTTTPFDAGKKDDTTNRGNAYFTDASADLVGRFSASPQNSIGYCNGEESCIYSGREHRLAAVFAAYDHNGSGVIDITDKMNSSLDTTTIKLASDLVVNGNMEADSNWTAVGTPTEEQSSTEVYDGEFSWKFVASGTDEGIISDTFDLDGASTYRVVAHVWPSVSNCTIEVTDGLGTQAYDTDHTGLTTDAWNEITFTFPSTEDGALATIQFDSGSSAAGTWYIDHVSIVKDGYYDHLLVMTTRPVQGFKFYVKDTEQNTVAADLEASVWDGSDFTACTSQSDAGTDSPSGTALGQTGSLTFDHTVSVAEFRHFEELYLYAYDIHLSDNTEAAAEIYHITCDPGFQDITNVWDGVYRQPIQFQVYDVDHYEDFTLHVNESSDVNAPIGGVLDGLVPATDYVLVMFEEQASAMRWTMLGDLVNDAATTITVSYWDGLEYQAVSNWNDGTLELTETKTLTQTGLISWDVPDDEEIISLFNSVGYVYKVEFVGANLTGTKGSTEEVVVDLVVGIPALKDTLKVPPFAFSALYKNRLMLGGFVAGSEGNRMDFCVSNAPDVYNGIESSMNGQLSLYFGGVEDITGAIQLYNRFGAGIFSMLLVLKDTEVYLLTGNSPDDFEIYPVSQTVGCPAPLTLAVAEVGFEVGKGLSRNVAIWLSNAGPVMFDGAILAPIQGIENYFDPNEPEYIEWDNVARSRGWVDQTYKEYNLLIPSTNGQEDCNVWLVYDLIHRKWFEKKTGTALFPQAGWNVMNVASGEQKIYSGIDDGTMIIQEEGTSFGERIGGSVLGSNITQTLKTGDFFPSENIWDECLIRKFKVICKRIPETSSEHNLEVRYYQNTTPVVTSGVMFQDSNAANGVFVDFVDMDVNEDGVNETEWAGAASALLNLSLDIGLERTVRLIQDTNYTGWVHAFGFEVSTNDVQKGWQPIVWGIRYRIERKDDTDNT